MRPVWINLIPYVYHVNFYFFKKSGVHYHLPLVIAYITSQDSFNLMAEVY